MKERLAPADRVRSLQIDRQRDAVDAFQAVCMARVMFWQKSELLTTL